MPDKIVSTITLLILRMGDRCISTYSYFLKLAPIVGHLNVVNFTVRQISNEPGLTREYTSSIMASRSAWLANDQ